MARIDETITSPNQSGRGGHTPRLIVCHIADGTYDGTKAWFGQTASQTSSHYIVGRDGRICQCVALDRMAWCNGTTTTGDSRDYRKSTVALVRRLGGNANAYSVSIEHEGYWTKTAGALTGKQLAASAWLIGHIRRQVEALYGHDIPVDRDHIVGHNEINPATRPSCPGSAFPWDALLTRAGGQAGRLYRVQLGAFSLEQNARAYLETVRGCWPDAFLASDGADGLHRVQIGAFTSRQGAAQLLQKARREGFEALIV